MIQEVLPDPSVENALTGHEPAAPLSHEAEQLIEHDDLLDSNDETPIPEVAQNISTLIEFPGRQLPEWRKQLSQRVREVQERKAREAAEEAAAAMEAGTVSCALPSGQLELVPNLEQPSMNPIVSKALERIDRARHMDSDPTGFSAAATAPALAPVTEALPEPETTAPEVETKHKLTVVAPAKTTEEPISPKPKRVISGSVDDVALSYLQSYLSMPAVDSRTRGDHAGLGRRTIAGCLDLLLVALMVSPVAAVIEFTDGNWGDQRVIGLMSGITIMTMFAYLTISVALTGRTLAMRMLSLRTIDTRTGLIPTGGQSIKRALAYIFSLIPLGLGLALALNDPDGRTIHDRVSKTMVIRS